MSKVLGLIEEINVGRRRKHQLSEAAVGEVVARPAARIAVDESAQRDGEGGAVADDQHPLVPGVPLVNLLNRRNDPRGDLAQRLAAAGWREVVIPGGRLDELIAAGQVVETFVLPVAKGVFPQGVRTSVRNIASVPAPVPLGALCVPGKQALGGEIVTPACLRAD